MLISQPGSDGQLTGITLDAGRARDITGLLLDIHAVLDQLHLDGTRPQITSTADAILRESGSPCTLPGLTGALDEVISQLTAPPARPSPASPRLAARTGQPLMTSRVSRDTQASPAG